MNFALVTWARLMLNLSNTICVKYHQLSPASRKFINQNSGEADPAVIVHGAGNRIMGGLCVERSAHCRAMMLLGDAG